jgi:6-phospho-3-hexuloisomerase
MDFQKNYWNWQERTELYYQENVINFFNKYSTVLNEIGEILKTFESKEIDDFINAIINAKTIVGYGAGRMGFGLKAFMMRLNHLGKNAYFMSDNYVPPLNKDDLFIVTSGSGKTKSVLSMLEIAINKAGCNTCAITGDETSPMATLANLHLKFKSCNGGLNSVDNSIKFNSIQPMTTLNEQVMFIFFDVITLMIIERMNIDLNETKKYHSNIE